MEDEGVYLCPSCDEEIVITIDLSNGAKQEYVEDCPVCCHPNVVHVEIQHDGDVSVWVNSE